MISFKQLSIPEVILIEPQIFTDERGFFFESYNQREFENAINRKVTFVQDNHSKSKQNTLRGLHYQLPPFGQGKLVRVIEGEIFDVAVDIRPDSPSKGEWVGELLSATNTKQLWIPPGFAHGFLVLSESAQVLYKTTNFYSKENEVCIQYDDKDFAIEWPLLSKPTLSEKDKLAISFQEYLKHFYGSK
jgi:dTDP-4-dehydrorhamnose 3,5-epimerase